MRHHAAKCYLVLISSILFYAGDLQAQRPPSSIDTSTTEGLYQYIFQNFDKPRVPTGYLEEYGAPIIPMETFNGILTDSNIIDINLWRTLYWQMQTAYLGSGTNAFGSITTVNNLMDTSLVNNSGIPVPIIVGTFNSVSPTAFTSNELKIVSGQVEDGSNNQNPFLSNNLFASSPAFNYSKTETPSFLFTQNLVLNNTAKTIASVSVNLGDNAGLRTVTWNTPVVANYLDTGWFTWTIKVVLSDNSILQCYSKFYVAGVNGGIADIMRGVGNLAQAKRKSTRAMKTGSGNSIHKSIRYSYIFRNSPDDYTPYTVNATIHVPPTSSYFGVYNDYVPIQYSSQNKSGKLMNPLIVVEGFDVASVAPDIEMSPYQMADFVDAIGDPYTYPFDLNTQLDEVGQYDLVFVTFKNGSDDITRNAALLEYVIQQVNTMKGSSPNQNVVLGLSMGGLVARYALADMTKKSLSTSTRLLITHDSPHEGANVPLGLQYLIEMVGGVHFFGYNISNVYPHYNEAINILNQTATKQMLIYCATGTNTFANNTFLSGVYRTMITFGTTGPQPTYQFIATSLGSQCADALFSPYTNLVNIQTNNFLFLMPIVSYKLSLNAQAFAMPNTGSTNTIASVNYQSKFKLFGLITIAKQIYSNSAAAPGTQLPVDGAPGALNNLVGGKNLPNLNPIIIPIPGILGIFGYVSGTAMGQPATFAFVPVASALDASPFNTAVFSQPFIDGINPNYPSTAKSFIAQEAFPNPNGSGTSYNNIHIQFTSRNSQWLFDAMQGISNTINCSTECSEGIAISGPAAFCSSATYTLNVPATTAITWSALPTGIISLVPSGNTVAATKVSPDPVTLTATINTCLTASLAVSTLATSTVTANMSGSCMNGVQDWLLTATPNMPGTNTNWQWTASPNSGIAFSSPNSPSTTAYVTKGGGAQVTYKDQCGDISQVNGATIYSQCGGSFVVAPNPASSTLTVSLSPSMVASASTTTITQINIYDNLGKTMKTSVFSQVKTATVDVSNLITGIYVIEIIDGSRNTERQELQILK